VAQENVEIVRSAFQTFGAEGIDAALAYFSPDLVWHTSDRFLEGSAYHGHDGMRTLANTFGEIQNTFAKTLHAISQRVHEG